MSRKNNEMGMMVQRVLVTGGAGFIGSHIVDKLVEEHYEVGVLDNLVTGNIANISRHISSNEVKFHDCDVSDFESVSKVVKGYDAVIHEAALVSVTRSVEYPQLTNKVNVDGTLNLLKAAVDCCVQKFIYACYDDKTLAYTIDGGLQHYSELKIGQRVLSLDINGNIEVGRINGIFVYPYTGKMIRFHGKSTDLLVTPNHKMLIRQHTLNTWKNTLKLEEASETSLRSIFKIPNGSWKGKEQNILQIGEKEYATRDLFYLMGLHIGDGCSLVDTKIIASKTGLTHREYIQQLRNPVSGQFTSAPDERIGPRETVVSLSHRNELYIPVTDKAAKRAEEVLDRLHMSFTRHGKYGVIIRYRSSRQFQEFLMEAGKHAHTKHIPSWMFEYDSPYLQALFDGIVDSDGHRRPLSDGTMQCIVTTVSFDLVQGLIQLGTKLSLAPTVTRIIPDESSTINGRKINSGPFYRVYFRTTERSLTRENVDMIDYTGFVWCVSVERNHNLLVYRNGKSAFSGNSSSSIYGDTETLPKKETMITAPISPYGVSKLTAENYCRTFAKVYGLKTVSLRYFNVYGPRQKYGPYSGVIPIFIKKALNNEPPVINGDGEQTRDFTFVDDVVQANLLALKNDVSPGAVYNAAAGGTISINDLARHIVNLAGKKNLQPVHGPERAGDIRASYANIRKISKELGFKPQVGIEAGLKRVLKWFLAGNQSEWD